MYLNRNTTSINRLFSRILFVLFFLQIISTSNLNAQISINTDNADPDASAMLDIKSTDKGVLIPRMTSAQRGMISSPAVGLLVFDTDTESFWFAETSGWVELKSGGTKELTDANGDTKIQVEESADEDVIRFDLEGTEFLKMERFRLSFQNNGGAISIGKNAGMDNTIGAITNNIFIGDNAGMNYSGGSNNIGLGANSLRNLTFGAYNNALGIASLESNDEGDFNAAFGYAALGANESGNGNTGIGYLAGLKNKTGSENLFMGYEAGYNGTNKSNNVALGYQAGRNNTENNNVFVGYKAGRDATGSNKLYIENSEATNPLIYGEFDTDLVRVNGTLNINNAFSFPMTDGISGQVLETDGSGNLAWSEKNEPQTIIEDADADTKIQVEESADEDIIRFDVGGTERLRMIDQRLEILNTNESIYIGENSGINAGLAMSNVTLGSNTLENTTVGGFNVAIGENSLNANTYGLSNIGIGFTALGLNTSGAYNIGIGFNAGRTQTTGSNNIFIGNLAGGGGTPGDGENNVFVGHSAGAINHGKGNIFLGYRAGELSTGSNKLFIENSNANTPLIYGEFDTDLVRINGTFNINDAYSFPTTDGAAGQVLETDGSGNLTWMNKTIDTNTDDQTIDVLNLNGTNLEISLADDGEATKTLDLSGLDTDTDTDDQTIDVLNLNGTNLEISLADDGEATKTLDLSGLDTDTDTDDQTIDVLNLNGTNLEISLADDGEATKTLDLSSLDTDTDTDDQTIDVLNLNGTNLEISLADDGEATKILDLSSLDTDTDTDDQTIDVLNLNGTNLEISLVDDGEATKILDLSSLDTDTDTDDQTIDVLNLNGTNLEISLADDGEATKTLNLSSIDTDNQTIDVLNLNGINLEISLADDGEATKTLDLSSLDTDTDDQTIDVLNLNGTNLEISLTDDGETTKTLDLSGINSTQSLIEDADADTKIQVEENSNEDIIRFDIGGSEKMTLSDELNVGVPSRIRAAQRNALTIQTTNNANDAGLAFRNSGSSYTWSMFREPVTGNTGQSHLVMAGGVSQNDPASLSERMRISNTGNVGINKPVPTEKLHVGGNAIIEGSLNINNNYTLPTTDGEATQILTTDGSGNVVWGHTAPIGGVMMYYGTTAPAGWLICDGSTFNAATYPELNTLLGGNTTPNFAGRFPMGVGNSATAGATNHNFGTNGGEEKHTLTINEMPAHSHDVTITFREGEEQGSGNNYSDLGDPNGAPNNSSIYTTNSVGGGAAHNNLPPFLTLNFIIKAN